MFDVITLGSATIDLFESTLGETITIHAKEGEEKLVAYPLGSKIEVKDIEFLIGGGGTNSATTFARLGFRTGFVGKIGRGANGYKVFQKLKDEGITFLGAVDNHEKDNTSFSIILDSIEHDRTILVFKGCSSTLSEQEIDLSRLKSKWFYSSSMTGESYEVLKIVFKHAKEINAKTAFNPSEYQTKKGVDFLKPVLINTDIFTLNYEEANLLLKRDNAPVELLLKEISNIGPSIVVITDGKKGLYAYRKENRTMYTLTPKQDINVVETTGAGDAFGSGFVSGLILGRDFEDALRIGLINSESVIQYKGAKRGILHRHELEKLLKTEKHPIKRKKI